MEKLKIIRSNSSPRPSTKTPWRKELQAKKEREWLQNPPVTNHHHIQKTLELIQEQIQLKGKHICDIGCGDGTLSLKLAEMGATIDAIDIAQNALKRAPQNPYITYHRSALPITNLPDDIYDLCLCADVIAELNPKDYRLAIAEFVRLLKPDGLLICSTPIDIHSEDALEHFAALLYTEFEPIAWKLSYHALSQRLKLPPFKFLETITHLFQGRRGLSHAICLAKPKPLF